MSRASNSTVNPSDKIVSNLFGKKTPMSNRSGVKDDNSVKSKNSNQVENSMISLAKDSTATEVSFIFIPNIKTF